MTTIIIYPKRAYNKHMGAKLKKGASSPVKIMGAPEQKPRIPYSPAAATEWDNRIIRILCECGSSKPTKIYWKILIEDYERETDFQKTPLEVPKIEKMILTGSPDLEIVSAIKKEFKDKKLQPRGFGSLISHLKAITYLGWVHLRIEGRNTFYYLDDSIYKLWKKPEPRDKYDLGGKFRAP